MIFLCSTKYFPIPAECMLIARRFQNLLCSIKSFKYHHDACFRNIVFIYFPAVPNNFQYHQNACFKIFSAVSNRFKQCQNACFRDIVFICLCSSESFQIPSECTLQRKLVFSRFSLQFQIVSNTGWMHALETLFFFFSVVPNRFKYRQNACFKKRLLFFSKVLAILLLILFHVAGR